MSSAIFRNYLDIINENSRDQIQLNEGIMDTLKSIVPKVMKFLGGDTIKDIAEKVKEITGGDFTPSQENAAKVARAFGFDKALQEYRTEEINEDWGLAGNWQGKLIQMLQLAGIGVGGAMGAAGIGIGNPLIGVGLILLLISDTVWSTDKGSVGSMGRYGNKGFETDKGPTTL